MECGLLVQATNINAERGMPHNSLWPRSARDETENGREPSHETPSDASSANPNVQSHASATDNAHVNGRCSWMTQEQTILGLRRRQSQEGQHSSLAKYAVQSKSHMSDEEKARRRQSDEIEPKSGDADQVDRLRHQLDRTLSGSGGDGRGDGARQSEASGSGRHVNGRLAHVNGRDRADADSTTTNERAASLQPPPTSHPPPHIGGTFNTALHGTSSDIGGLSLPTSALSDTPATTAPSSPHIGGKQSSTSSETSGSISLGAAMRPVSGTSTPRVRPTTLDIPGLTKSKFSPDGRIAKRDVGAKLVIVMVGLPARGKSYITKKLARYLNWQQHDTRIFNVGEKRRTVAGGPLEKSGNQAAGHDNETPAVPVEEELKLPNAENAVPKTLITLNGNQVDPPATPQASKDLPNGAKTEEASGRDLQRPDFGEPKSPVIAKRHLGEESLEHNAAFFDPNNQKAAQIREQVARETLDELLDYILDGNGSVGILDATNSTLERRQMVMNRIRERAGPELNVLFLESRCVDPDLLEANMRLKLNGPDYKGMDPHVALADFRKRVVEYEKAYVPLGEYEEQHNMPYIQMIDVGRKVISHQIKGFLMAQTNYYLLNFNLAPRQIWITRHGLSVDNISGRIGGDSELAPEGHVYAQSLARFMEEKRREWEERQLHQLQHSHFPPRPGDASPPNPHYSPSSPQAPAPHGDDTADVDAAADVTSDVPAGYEPKNFCVWTSMLRRSVQTAAWFNDEAYDIKQMRMLDELHAGMMEGLTYAGIAARHPGEYAARRADKLHYRYPGPGGEGYLDIIHRLRPVIVELERMTDHVLLVGHRSVARVLLAYFRGLSRADVADVDVPLGMLYCLEPRPYGVAFRAYRWDRRAQWFVEVPDFHLSKAPDAAGY